MNNNEKAISINVYLTEWYEGFSDGIVAGESVVVEYVEVKHPALQLLNRES